MVLIPFAVYEPTVALVVPVYNEAPILKARILNCLQLQYPANKLQFIFITDGSTDRSNALIQQYPQIQLLFEPMRKGKMAAVNRAMKYVTADIVIFSDANSFLNAECVRLVTRHYCFKEIGGVAGEKIVIDQNKRSSSVGESIYWRYESMLKQLDSNLNTVVGAAGELFSMRTCLFTPQPESTILDDFMLSFQLCLHGYKVVYEPMAFACEAPSLNLVEEAKRRTRIASGAFQTLLETSVCRQVLRFPLLAFQFFSRRVLRWVVAPPALLVLLLTSGWLCFNNAGMLYYILFYVQAVLYVLAAVGYINYKNGRHHKLFYIPFYFLFMNLLLVAGFTRFMRKGHTAVWDKAKRKTMPAKAIVAATGHFKP